MFIGQKGLGKFRKSKAYGLIGCLTLATVMGLASTELPVIGGGVVHAEVIQGGNDIKDVDVHSTVANGVVIIADCDGLVDEASVELDELLVELEEIDVELCDVDDDSLVFSMDFSTIELVCVEEGGETVVDLSEYTPIITDIRIIKITATPIKYGINFFTFNSSGLNGVISTSASFSKKPKIPAFP